MTRDRNDGFTLVEVLVALALTALVSLVLLHGIRLAAAGLDRHSRQQQRLDDRRSLDALLRRALGSAARSGFSGGPDGVSFLGLAEDSGPGLYRVEIILADGKLVLRRALAEPAGDPHSAESVLAADAGAFRLAYFGTQAMGEEPGWHDRWQGLAVPPRLVRLTFDALGSAVRPPLVIPIWSAGS
jgi:prepilin-type N-terminal cleavage/methylation domain-containing protein